MSVNLHLGVVIRDYRPERAEAIRRAVHEVLVQQEIDGDLPPLSEVIDAGGPCLISRSNPNFPVIITGAYEWALQVDKALKEAVARANGAPCQVRFDWDDADEDRDDPEDDES